MNIGIIQLHAGTGDFSRNVRAIIESYRKCIDEGAQLVVAPALSLCGPDMDDLVLRTSYPSQNSRALEYLSTEISSIPLIVGTLTPAQDESDGFYNAAFVIRHGEIQELAAQRHLDDYGIAHDSRYLLSSEFTDSVEIDGIRVATLIGADSPLLIDADSCDLLLRLPTAPWTIGMLEREEKEDATLALQFACPVVRVRLVGGQQSSIYPGASTIIGATGETLLRLESFSEDIANIDLLSARQGHAVKQLPSPIEQVRLALLIGIRDFIGKSGFSSVCLGLSGGIDSALVATLAVQALGAEHVHGLALPGPYSSQGSLDDAYALAENLGISCQTVKISDCFEALKVAMKDVFEGTTPDTTEENMQSRLRGIALMSFSNKFNHMLLTTGNKSEISVGYCTMYGDTCGGLNPIGDLYKTEVYELSNHLNKTSSTGELIPQNTIDKLPSAELRPDQTDQDSLPPYEILDAILRELIDGNISATDLIALSSDRFEEQIVRKIQRLVTFSEWKHAQCAPILKITPCSFGRERVIPFIHKFSD
ncbi:MAG: NAD+ synthase [Akkermansia sp.]